MVNINSAVVNRKVHQMSKSVGTLFYVIDAQGRSLFVQLAIIPKCLV